eukprot:4883763-Pyramimonas_sp.AAC.1
MAHPGTSCGLDWSPWVSWSPGTSRYVLGCHGIGRLTCTALVEHAYTCTYWNAHGNTIDKLSSDCDSVGIGVRVYTYHYAQLYTRMRFA